MYKILKAEKLADKIYLMDVEAPRVAKSCQPGQFVIVKMDEAGERIPLTICDYDREAGTITIVFQEVGESTYRMAELKAGDGISFEMKMKADLEQTDADRLEIDLRCGGEKKTICIFDFKHGIMKIDRNHSDGWSKGISYSTLFLKGKKELNIHIFSDQSSLEIFADNYQNNHANNVFAGDNQNQILIRAYGGDVLIRDYESYGMKECFR